MQKQKDSLVIGIDFGGTSLRSGIFDGDYKLIDTISMKTRVSDGPDAVVCDMRDMVVRLLRKHACEDRLVGVGVGSPGPINLRDGLLGQLPNFPGWNGFALRSSIESALSLPVFLEGDANAAALAEWRFGAGRQEAVKSMLMLTLGTGVGSGLILHEQIWHGIVGMGVEAGHFPLIAEGIVCGCGGRGCLEAYASATALCRAALERVAREPGTPMAAFVRANPAFSALDLANLAEAGDPGAQSLFNQLGYYIGLGLAVMVSTLDLPLYVVGGGLASAWNLFAPSLFRTLYENSYVYRLQAPLQHRGSEKDRPFVCSARLGPIAGLLGAALLPSTANNVSRLNLQAHPSRQIDSMSTPGDPFRTAMTQNLEK